jgi:hypothetical protein
LETIRRRLERVGTESKSVDMLTGRQRGIWALFEHTLAVSWVIPAHDQAARDRVTKDIENVTACLEGLLPRRLDAGDNAPTWFVHDGLISGGTAARAGWRALFAEAQIRWHQATHHHGETTS